MLSALALAAASLTYGFGPGDRLNYDVQVHFDGFLPVMGGQNAKVQVDLGVEVQGLRPEQEGAKSTASEIRAFEMRLNGAVLPVGLDNMGAYFPKTTIVFTPLGKILKSDAPNVSLPVRLPGLDAQRFPDLTYLPVEFPEAGVEVGRKWSYTKNFSGSEVVYTVTPTKLEDDVLEADLHLRQAYTTFEDRMKNTVPSADKAVAKVDTMVEGNGKLVFDRKRGVFTSFDAKTVSTSHVEDLRSGQRSDRKLVSDMKLRLKDGFTARQAPAARQQTLLERALSQMEMIRRNWHSYSALARYFISQFVFRYLGGAEQTLEPKLKALEKRV
jgi:hypothetical protein